MSLITQRSIKGLLLDLGGVFFVGDRLLPGAVAALDYLNTEKIPYRFITNTTTISRATLAATLQEMGLVVDPDDIISPPYVAVLKLREMNSPKCRLLLCEEVAGEFSEFEISDHHPDVIVIGDIGSRWDYDLMSDLFCQINAGAKILALHKGKSWQEPDGLHLDIGAFIVGLEYATGRIAMVIGKPSDAYFEVALAELRLPASEIAMIGDDIDSDVGAAQRLGMTGVLVRTGKYRPDSETASDVVPDAVIESIADIAQVARR